MIKTIEKRICDVCTREVKDFNGMLVLKYMDYDNEGCSIPTIIEHEEICIDCCRTLNKIITEGLKEIPEC